MSTTNAKRMRRLNLSELDECNGGMTLTTALHVLPNVPHAQALGPQANIAQAAVQTQVPGLNKNILDQLLANQTTLARQIQLQNTAAANAAATARAQALNNAYGNQLSQLLRALNPGGNNGRYNDPNGYRDTYGNRGQSRSSGRRGGGGDHYGGGGRSRAGGGGHGPYHPEPNGGNHPGGWGIYNAPRRDRDRGRTSGKPGADPNGGYGVVPKTDPQRPAGKEDGTSSLPASYGKFSWDSYNAQSERNRDLSNQGVQLSNKDGSPNATRIALAQGYQIADAYKDPNSPHYSQENWDLPKNAAQIQREGLDRALGEDVGQMHEQGVALMQQQAQADSLARAMGEDVGQMHEQGVTLMQQQAQDDGLARAMGEDVGQMHDQGATLMQQASAPETPPETPAEPAAEEPPC